MRKHHVQLSDVDREHLEGLLRKGQLPAKEFRRVMGLLELDRGKTFQDVCQSLNVSPNTGRRWALSYAREGLGMLKDKHRAGRPPIIDGLSRAQITALACTEAPEDKGRWDLRLLADRAVELGYCEHISHTHVGTILKKTKSNRTRKNRGA